MTLVRGLVAVALLLFTGAAALADGPAKGLREPYPDPYLAQPDFIAQALEQIKKGERGKVEDYDKKMELSFEPTFFTLNDLAGYSKPEPRSTALVRAGLEKEEQREYREALEIYQKVIDQHPDDLYRVSKFGIYVPVGQYCQRRILQFPASDLAFYRSKYDARAKDAFQQALAKHSLAGLAEVVQDMLATSYGGRAMLALGDAALDRGHDLEALEHYLAVREIFPDKDLHTPELDLKIALCRRKLGDNSVEPAAHEHAASGLTAEQQGMLRQVLDKSKQDVPPFHSQLASAPHVASDDYTLLPPTADPMALRAPVWKYDLPGTRNDFFVYSQPVVTGNSILYRHKNIVYCHSIFTGELRWKNDLGGRVQWQSLEERQYPQEDLLVQDGLVFTAMYKAGPTLVALDETTGQLKWAYGPMVASNKEESQIRFESAPAGGPKTIYASYVLDDIEGNTHTDTEYGVMAFESTTGRLQWRRAVCRMRPGEFSSQFADKRRNLIRSFTSPPLYAQGTVYYNTNAGAVAAVDAFSGQIKWVMRYPYYALPYSVHDSTRQFGEGKIVDFTRIMAQPHRPMFWLNQRPLLIGEKLFVLPVDSPMMFSIDRRTGAVLWSKPKLTRNRVEPYNKITYDNNPGGTGYLLGRARNGKLVFVYSGRESQVHLVDLQTGKTEWMSPDLVAKDPSPIMHHWAPGTQGFDHTSIVMDGKWFETAARPLLTSDDRVYVASFLYVGWPMFGWSANLAELDLDQRSVTARRIYYDGQMLGYIQRALTDKIPNSLQVLEAAPIKNADVKERIAMLKEMEADHVPENSHGPFLPFSRVTFERYGQPFELRASARSVEMVFDHQAVKKALADREDPQGLFARAELALGESRLEEAAQLMQNCLAKVSSEDVDFRAAVNQQLYKVHRSLAQSGIRARRNEQELSNCLGMSQTVGTLADEMETLFALADAYERKGDLATAGRMLQSAIGTYGQNEYPISSALGAGRERLMAGAQEVMDKGRQFVRDSLHGAQFDRGIQLMQGGLPLYFSSLSPLEKDLAVRAGDRGAAALVRLQQASPQFQQELEASAKQQLEGVAPEEQLHRLWRFPATKAGQGVLDGLLRRAADAKGPEGRRMMWRLADVASASGLKVPLEYESRVAAPAESDDAVGSSRVDLQACKLEYSIVSPK